MTEIQSGVRAALVVLFATSLAACGNLQQPQQKVESVRQTITELRQATTENAGTAGVQRTRRSRLAGEEVQVRPVADLPAVFTKQVTFVTQGQGLADALETVSGLIALPIRAREVVSGETSSAAGANGAGSSAALNTRVTIEFNGTVRALLDELAARTNSSWRYVGARKTVEFFRYETRTISVNVPPGAKQIAASISLSGVSGGGGGGGGGGGSGGAGNVAVSQSLSVDPWNAIMRGVQSILSDGSAAPAAASTAASSTGSAGLSAAGPSGTASASPELGIITVTARPGTMDRVASYLNSINARFAQNVLVDVKVFSLALDSQASLGFSLDALYQRLKRFGVSVVGASPLQAGTGTPGQFTITATDPGSRWSGSSLVAQALSQFGDVALQTQGQVLAVNGQPSPIQVANEVNYLASSATTQTANVGSTTTLTPGSRVVGFTANFVPLILNNNRILLNYQMQISQLTALTQISSGNNSIQTPQISSQSMQQSAYMRDGEAIVLFGFDQSRESVGSALTLASASKAATSQRQMVVIVIQVNGGTKNEV
ncbi:MAG: type II secretion system protein GspD [Vicinamibacterales bacterium]